MLLERMTSLWNKYERDNINLNWEKIEKMNVSLLSSYAATNALSVEARNIALNIKDSADRALQTANNANSKAVSAENKAVTVENLVTTLKKQLDDAILTSGESDLEVVAARTDTTTGTQYPTIGNRLDKIVTNPILRNALSDSATLSDEVLTSGMAVTLGDGWTGDIANGFMHVSGKNENLVIEIPTLLENSLYQIEVDITNPAINDNGQSDYWLSLGGSAEFETYRGKSLVKAYWGVRTISGTQLVVRPWENYSGTLKFSIKRVIGASVAHTKMLDSRNVLSTEFRVNAALRSVHVGLNSGRYANDFAQENVSLGDNTLANNISGFWNTVMGFGAMQDAVNATRCVAVGRIALQRNISGDRHIAVGSFAMANVTGGRASVAVGVDALYHAKNPVNNIAIGLVAMAVNDGENNIAIGERTMSGAPGGKNNTAIGRLALYYIENGAENNNAFGAQSMYRAKTAKNNVALGFYSLFMNESGENNFAAGFRAMQENLANDNIGIGFEVLRRNTIGYNLIAMGYQAAYNNTTGRGNIALGFKTLHANAEGLHNVAIGHEVLMSTTAGNNVGLGFNTLKLTTTGASNTALGTGAGAQNVTGAENTFVGAQAGSTIDGTRNVMMGRNAGANRTSGNNNVIIGAAAGTQGATGDNNILIGYNAQTLRTYSSNYLNIGDVIKSQMDTKVIEISKLKLTDLPTTQPSESGLIWNDGGILKVA